MKKVISAVLCSAMLLSSAVPAFAASEYDVVPISMDGELETVAISDDNKAPDMKAALTAVKSRISIPDTAEFDYYTYSNELGTVFAFDWSFEENGSNRFIYVECDENGFIYSYNDSYSTITTDYKRLPTIDYSKAKSLAGSMLRRLMPSGYSAYKLVEGDESDYSEYYRFEYQGYKNNVPVSDASIGIEVNGVTGRVSNYYASPIRSDVSYEDSANVIGVDKAREAFMSLSEAELVYSDFYDESGEKYIRPVYNVGRVNINALTGETAKLYKYQGYSSSNDKANMEASTAADAAGSVSFSDAELDAINGLSGYLTVGEAEKKVRSYKYFELDSFSLVDSSMRKGSDDYVWSLEFVKAFDRDDEESAMLEDVYANFTIDAKTGEIYSFNKYDYNAEEPKNIEYYRNKAASEAEKMLNELVGENIRISLKLSTSDNAMTAASKADNRYIYFTYQRVNEDVVYSRNYVTMRFDSYTGKICQYRIVWDDSAQFPSVGKAIGSAAAKNIVTELYGFSLRYSPICDEHGKVLSYALIYVLDGTYTTVDALSSDILNTYSSSENNDTSALDGHWAEEYVKKLYSVGVCFNDNGIGDISPDSSVTDTELIYMLATARRRFYEPYPVSEASYSDFCSALLKYKVTDAAPVLKGKPISAIDAVVYALDAFRYGDVAKLNEIFKSDGLEDIAADKLGYAAIANAMKLLRRDVEAESMTYAEAAYMVYSLLSKVQ